MPIPSSIIRFGNAPLTKPDSGVCYSRTFSSTSEQKAWFTARLTNVKEGNTEIRPYSGRYGAPWNADDIITSDYMMFTNDGAKWYYAFIDRVVYVNEQRCDIYFTIDDLQTWYFDYTLRPVYVEREHAADDSIGANILDEPISTGELRYSGIEPMDELSKVVCIVDSMERPNPDGTKKQDAKGGYINGIYCPNGKFAFSDAIKLNQFIRYMNELGGGSSIQGMYYFPTAMLDDSNIHNGNMFERDLGVVSISTKVLDFVPTAIKQTGTFGGYTPHNNKLYTYPYSFMRLSNNRGIYHDYRFEFFSGQPKFKVYGFPSADGDIFIRPVGYNQVSDNPIGDESITTGGLPNLSWAYNAGENWTAQNKNAQTWGFIRGGLSVIGGLGGAALAASHPVAGALTAMGSQVLSGSLVNESQYMGTQAVNPAVYAGLGAAGAGANSLISQGASFMDAQNAPDKALGSTNNAAAAGLGQWHPRLYRMCCQRQFAERIDQFFDVYGYTTQRVKTPDRSSRPHVNYCKTRDAQFQGTVPADAMDRINRVWNQGIWWFHDDNIGDFSIANK